MQSPLPDNFDNVVIPLRLRLTNNSQQMRVTSDTIPVTTKYFSEDGTLNANFYVQDFAMHLNGSTGSPFPLLTNPSSCAAGGFSTIFGDTQANKTAAAAGAVHRDRMRFGAVRADIRPDVHEAGCRFEHRCVRVDHRS